MSIVGSTLLIEGERWKVLGRDPCLPFYDLRRVRDGLDRSYSEAELARLARSGGTSSDRQENGWRVVSQEGERIVLGHDDEDEFRLGITLSLDGDQMVPDAIERFYPCRACGWRNACVEGCHS